MTLTVVTVVTVLVVVVVVVMMMMITPGRHLLREMSRGELYKMSNWSDDDILIGPSKLPSNPREWLL